jgi:membrane fusion protein (multidrug efflux system)
LHQKGLVSAGAFEGLKYDLDDQRAANDLASLSLSYSEIRAPFAGIVSTRHVKLGQELAVGSKVFRVTDPTPLKAAVYVPERELARLKIGQAASISVDALAGRSFPATVKLVSPTVDAATATFKVTLEVDDPKGDLKPGMFSRVGIVFERRSETLTIPASPCSTPTAPRTCSWFRTARPNSAPSRPALQRRQDRSDEGLTGTEQVVVVGQNGLKDGNPVRVVSLEQTAKAGS